MAERSVVFDLIARVQGERDVKKLGDSVDGVNNRLRQLSKGFPALRAAAIGLGPALLPVMATAAASAAGLGVALASAGSAAGVFGAVTKSAFTEVKTASDKSADLRDKIRLLKREAAISGDSALSDKFMKKAAEATVEYNARLSLLPPATRNVVRGYDNMKSSWSNFVDNNKPAVYAIMTRGFDSVGKHVQDLQPLFNTGAKYAKIWVNSIAGWADRGGLTRVVSFLNGQAGPALGRLTSILHSLAVVGGNLASNAAFSKSGGLLAFIERGAAGLAKWSSGNGLTKLMGYLTKTGPEVASTLKTFVAAVVHISQAVTPLAPLSLAVAGALARIVAAIPPRVLTLLVGGYVAWSVALRAVAAGSKLMAGAQLILNAVMRANPIGLVITAIAALAIGIIYAYKHSETFRRIVNAAFLTVRQEGTRMWGALKTAFAGITGAVSGTYNWVKSHWPLLLGILTGPIGAAVIIVVRHWGQIKQGAVTAFNDLVRFARGVPAKITGAFGSVGRLLYQKGKDVVNGLWDGMKAVWKNITGWIPTLAGWIKAHKGPPSLDRGLLVQAGKDIMGGFEKGLKHGGLKALGFVESVAGKVGGVFTGPVVSGSNVAIGQMLAARYGWTGGQWDALRTLWSNESGWNNNAQNPTSTAYGIAQFLNSTWASVGAVKTSDPVQQIAAGLRYIQQSYGTPANALSQWLGRSPHWYGSGMAPTVFDKPTLIGVGERGAETVSVTPHGRSRVGGNTYVTINIDGALDPVAVGKQVQQVLLRLKRNNGGQALGLA